jgi:hypothetical protein
MMAEPGKTAKAAAKTKRTARSKTGTKARKRKPKPLKTISADSREQLISEAAYFKAESRGFEGGDPEQDWLEAESEVDTKLLETSPPKK